MFRVRLSGFEDQRARQGVECIEDPGPIIDVHIDRNRALWVLLRRFLLVLSLLNSQNSGELRIPWSSLGGHG